MPEPRWDWFGAILEAEATGRPIRPPDDSKIRDIAPGVAAAAKEMLKQMARIGIGMVPYVGNPTDVALTWREEGYGMPTPSSVKQFASNHYLAMIPLLGVAKKLHADKIRKAIGVELPGVVRLARIQHVDDPVFATHPSRKLVFTTVDDPQGIDPSTLVPHHTSRSSNFVKRVADVEIRNPVLVFPSRKALVNPTLVARYAEILNPRLADANRWVATGFPVRDVPIEDIAKFTRSKKTMRDIYRWPEGRERWDKLTRSEKADLLDAWRRGIQNAEATGGIGRMGLQPGTTAINVTPDNLVADWARRNGFDAVIAVGPKLRLGRPSMFDITEIALVPNKRRLVTRSDGSTVELLVREPLRVY